MLAYILYIYILYTIHGSYGYVVARHLQFFASLKMDTGPASCDMLGFQPLIVAELCAMQMSMAVMAMNY